MRQKAIEEILRKLGHALKINVLLTGADGAPVVMPNLEFGWKSLALDLPAVPLIQKFHREEKYWHWEAPSSRHVFAVPAPIGFVMAGPIYLQKRPAGDCDQNIRVLSYNGVLSVLDLIAEIVEQTPAFADTFLSSLLDLALSMAQAESGSIMMLNQATQELNVLVFKDVVARPVQPKPQRMGEGIAGLVAQERKAMLIAPEGNNRIQHLLNKPDLKYSVVLPIISGKNDVVGVLSVGTYQEAGILAAHPQEVAHHLSELTQTAFQ